MKTKLVPTLNHVIVKPDDKINETKSGLVLPDIAKKKPISGVIVAVGEGEFDLPTGYRKPTGLHVGQHVLFNYHQGAEFVINEETLIILSSNVIIAIVEDEITDPLWKATGQHYERKEF